MFINILLLILFSGFILLEIEWPVVFFVQGSSVSKTKTNDEYYQKSDYRLLRINILFLIC